MFKMLVKIFFAFASYASLLSLILTIWPINQRPSTLQLSLFALASFILLLVVGNELLDYFRYGPRLFTQQRKINDYMYKWVSRGGRVAIFSRDLSWAGEDRIRQLLLDKARPNELCICLPERIPAVEVLEREGAQICVYPELDYTPESRFTIVNRGRMGARVAIGRAIRDKHRIDEFSSGEHPVFSVANDLVEIVIRLERLRHQR